MILNDKGSGVQEHAIEPWEKEKNHIIGPVKIRTLTRIRV